MKKRTEHFILVLILLLGFILRLLSSVFHSYSSDELSAITRLKYDSFSDLIELGVKTGDMHPAGVQLFMKGWSLIFGTSEFLMRLPFVLFGTLSIYLIYKIGKRFSASVGLFSAGLWAVLLFPVIQSELARPYSPGLFFTLLSGFFILKFTQDQLTAKQKWWNAVWLTLSITASMYTHYFAFVTVGFMAVSALLFIKRDSLLPYISAGIASILLFLPHLSITIYQTSVDGGLQWLAPPNKSWLFHFIFHAFNSSWILLSVIITALAVSIGMRYLSHKTSISKINTLLIIWFFGTYIVGFLLSHYLTPVLKYPVLLFVLPFLILSISVALPPLFKIAKTTIPIAIVVITLISTTVEKQLFESVHYEVFKELSSHIRTWEHSNGKENIGIAMNISNPYYLNYYALQNGKAHELQLDLINYGDAPILDSVLRNSDKSHFVLGYSARHTPIQFLNQTLAYYPYISDYQTYNNSAVFLLSKSVKNQNVAINPIVTFSFPSDKDKWDYEVNKFDHKRNIYLTDSVNQYRPQFMLATTNLLASNEQYIRVELRAKVTIENEITIVAVPEDSEHKPVLDNYGKPIWLGLNIEKDLLLRGEGSFAFSLPPNMPATGYVKIYIWNRNKMPFILKNIDIDVLKNIWNN